MSNKIYRSALGKPVDMGSLMTKNEMVRAVGNMSVNARGDNLTSSNTISNPKSDRIARQYNKQIANQIVDVPVNSSSVELDDPNVNDTIDGFDITESATTTEKTADNIATNVNNQAKKKSGLASAIAKAREVEQKKMQTPREESRSKKGVNKI